MVTSQIVILMIVKLHAKRASHTFLARCAFRFLPRLAWFTGSSHSNAAVTVWLTSLRTFGDSWAWLSVGRLIVDLK